MSAHDGSPYRVIFSAPVWKAVGRMPQSAFDTLQAAVDRLTLESPGQGTQVVNRLQGSGWELRYAWDDAERTVTLVDITPGPAASP